MRGADAYNEVLFSTARREDFVPPKHPLRPIPREQVEVLLLLVDRDDSPVARLAQEQHQILSDQAGCPSDDDLVGRVHCAPCFKERARRCRRRVD